MRIEVPISDRYRRSLRIALAWTSSIVIISALVMDGGEFARLSFIGICIFWGVAAEVMFRRPKDPSEMDLLLIRWGCFVIVLLLLVGTRIVWSWRGLI